MPSISRSSSFPARPAGDLEGSVPAKNPIQRSASAASLARPAAAPLRPRPREAGEPVPPGRDPSTRTPVPSEDGRLRQANATALHASLQQWRAQVDARELSPATLQRGVALRQQTTRAFMQGDIAAAELVRLRAAQRSGQLHAHAGVLQRTVGQGDPALTQAGALAEVHRLGEAFQRAQEAGRIDEGTWLDLNQRLAAIVRSAPYQGLLSSADAHATLGAFRNKVEALRQTIAGLPDAAAARRAASNAVAGELERMAEALVEFEGSVRATAGFGRVSEADRAGLIAAAREINPTLVDLRASLASPGFAMLIASIGALSASLDEDTVHAAEQQLHTLRSAIDIAISDGQLSGAEADELRLELQSVERKVVQLQAFMAFGLRFDSMFEALASAESPSQWAAQLESVNELVADTARDYCGGQLDMQAVHDFQLLLRDLPPALAVADADLGAWRDSTAAALHVQIEQQHRRATAPETAPDAQSQLRRLSVETDLALSAGSITEAAHATLSHRAEAAGAT
jgi:hypothetical protein